MLECPACGRRFRRVSGLAKHLRARHGVRIPSAASRHDCRAAPHRFMDRLAAYLSGRRSRYLRRSMVPEVVVRASAQGQRASRWPCARQ